MVDEPLVGAKDHRANVELCRVTVAVWPEVSDAYLAG